MSAREDIAEAASAIDGVSITPYWRQVTEPLAGFIDRTSTVPDESGIGWLDTWNLVIGLGQDFETAARNWDAIAAELLDAIRPHLNITGVVFADLQLDSASIPGAVITGTREG